MFSVGDRPADETLAWLLGGDAAVQFQTYRDLLGDERPELQRRIASEGDAGTILAAHSAPGWGRGFYEPKWTCPHYSLLELRDLAVARDHPICVGEVAAAIKRHKGGDGGYNPRVGWPGACAPGSHGTVRDSLPSHGSCCSGHQGMADPGPVCEQAWGARDGVFPGCSGRT